MHFADAVAGLRLSRESDAPQRVVDHGRGGALRTIVFLASPTHPRIVMTGASSKVQTSAASPAPLASDAANARQIGAPVTVTTPPRQFYVSTASERELRRARSETYQADEMIARHRQRPWFLLTIRDANRRVHARDGQTKEVYAMIARRRDKVG